MGSLPICMSHLQEGEGAYAEGVNTEVPGVRETESPAGSLSPRLVPAWLVSGPHQKRKRVGCFPKRTFSNLGHKQTWIHLQFKQRAMQAQREVGAILCSPAAQPQWQPMELNRATADDLQVGLLVHSSELPQS